MVNNNLPHFASARYQNFRKIGRGGMGSVFEAHDTVLNKPVAIKLLSLQNWSDEQVVRFQREAQALAKLNHPNIARIYDFGFDDNNAPYMVLELIDGIDLDEYLRTNPSTESEIIDIAMQVCKALEQAHEKGIVHRDLKPGNILVQPDLQIKIVDFGIAKFLGDESQSKTITAYGAVVGSPLYMSPEQVKREEITERTDVYSFGCVLFMMLTGQPPFRGKTAIETASMHLETQPPTLSSRGAEVQAELETIVARCLKKNPNERFDSMSQLESSLRRYVPPESESNPRTTSDTTETPPSSKTSFAPIALAVILIGGLVAIVLFSALAPTESDPVQAPAPAPMGIEKDGETIESGLSRPDDGNSSISVNISGENQLAWKTLTASDKEQGLRIVNVKKIPAKFFPRFHSKPILTKLVIDMCDELDADSLQLKDYMLLKTITFHDCKLIRPSIMRALADAPSLTNLEFKGCEISDLSGLNKMPRLRNLKIEECIFSDKQLASVSNLKQLHALSVSKNPQITGAELNLGSTKSLDSLCIHDCVGLTPRGLQSLSRFEVLTKLEMNDNEITREKLAAVRKIRSLTGLQLTHCPIDDDAYNELGKFTGLKNLSLESTDIHAGQTKSLYSLKNLERLDLRNCHQLEMGDVHDLTRQLPGCKIEIEGIE